MKDKKFTILDFAEKKKVGSKITMLTAYDYPTASVLDQAGVDSILVGDSLNMVVLGRESTVSVTMDEMIHHAKAVKQGVKNAFIIADMPFMSYQVNAEEALKNAGRFVKEAGCDAVKLEGAGIVAGHAKKIVDAGIPVIGHIGLTPQKATKMGGFRVQGKDEISAKSIMNDAVELESSGCFAVILECIPKKLAGEITSKLKIPTVGIGAGVECDGQVMVLNDMLGFFNKFTPKFVKKYADLNSLIENSVKEYLGEVLDKRFPDDEHSY